jgi:hypothetical protein
VLRFLSQFFTISFGSIGFLKSVKVGVIKQRKVHIQLVFIQQLAKVLLPLFLSKGNSQSAHHYITTPSATTPNPLKGAKNKSINKSFPEGF